MFEPESSDETGEMLRCALISSDSRLAAEVAAALGRIPDLEVAKVFAECPSANDLLRTIRVRRVNVLLFYVNDLLRSESLAKSVDDLMPGFPIISVGNHEDLNILHNVMHLGVREHVKSPIVDATLRGALEAVRQRLATHPLVTFKQADLYTFLPAKPGTGTTTIAVSASCALAEEFGARTLLLDGDLAAGTIQFLLKLGHSASFADALSHTENLDEDLWAQMVGKWGKLEILHAGRLDPPPDSDPKELLRLLSMARAQYEVICADLPSSFDPISIALMRESRKIFLVTTPEVVPLHMASSRMRRLTELGLEDRVSLLVNRKVKISVTDAEIEAVVGIPVSFTFSNDYRGVQGAIINASPLSHDSELGKSVLDLAHSLAPHLEVQREPHRRKFLQFFRIPHEVEADVAWRG